MVIDMKEIRLKAQSEVLGLCTQHFDVADSQRFSRDECDEKLGYSWTNIIDIEPTISTTVSELHVAIAGLRERGYTVSVDATDRITIQVATSYAVIERLEEPSSSGELPFDGVTVQHG